MTPSTASNRTPLYCSFCRRDQSQLRKLVGGPGVHICDGCVDLCVRVLKGKSTPGFSGWETLTDEQLLKTLPAASAAHVATEQKLKEHVALLRARRVSWE